MEGRTFAGTGSFFGHSFNLYSFHVPSTNEYNIDSVSFNIGLKTFWPYDPGDTDPYPGKDGSGPIYDSVTGAQLRDPFSIVKRGDGTFYNPLYTPP